MLLYQVDPLVSDETNYLKCLTWKNAYIWHELPLQSKWTFECKLKLERLMSSFFALKGKSKQGIIEQICLKVTYIFIWNSTKVNLN